MWNFVRHNIVCVYFNTDQSVFSGYITKYDTVGGLIWNQGIIVDTTQTPLVSYNPWFVKTDLLDYFIENIIPKIDVKFNFFNICCIKYGIWSFAI